MELTLDEQETHTLFGNHDENLRMIEDEFGVKISSRGNEIIVQGAAEDGGARREAPRPDAAADPSRAIRSSAPTSRPACACCATSPTSISSTSSPTTRSARRSSACVTPRNLAQKLYLQAMQDYDIVFAIGPAGTGKTFLAVAAAAAALAEKSIKRIILCRPAVEAGERLGFLPGDIAEKVNPYLRPLYDSLYDIIGFEKVEKMMERSVIEIAPLAFMRGRTLNDSFIILDEAQNTTPEQMKMFLTRLGFGSKAVVTGDVTQVDLPTGKKSGLREARKILEQRRRDQASSTSPSATSSATRSSRRSSSPTTRSTASNEKAKRCVRRQQTHRAAEA